MSEGALRFLVVGTTRTPEDDYRGTIDGVVVEIAGGDLRLLARLDAVAMARKGVLVARHPVTDAVMPLVLAAEASDEAEFLRAAADAPGEREDEADPLLRLPIYVPSSKRWMSATTGLRAPGP